MNLVLQAGKALGEGPLRPSLKNAAMLATETPNMKAGLGLVVIY